MGRKEVRVYEKGIEEQKKQSLSIQKYMYEFMSTIQKVSKNRANGIAGEIKCLEF